MPGNACSHLLDFGSFLEMAEIGTVAPGAEVKKILEYCLGVGSIGSGAEQLKEIGRATILFQH